MFGRKNMTNYKFKSLRPYSWSRVVSRVKKFRKVYDRWELNYLSVEFEFYNKLFDEKDWQADITLKAYSMDGGKKNVELCVENKTVEVKSDQNIVTIDYGWGNDEYGKFWQRGHYIWEAYIEGELAGTVDFYIEDHGRVSTDDNPYFKVLSLRTYEAPYGDVEIDKRTYLKKFDVKKTRYIMGELRFENKLNEEWLGEFFFNIYDDTGQLIGSGDVMNLITPEKEAGETFTVGSGWGTPEPGSWIEDNYTMEVVFMDTVVAIIPFSIGNEFVERISDYEALLNEEIRDQYNPNLRGVNSGDTNQKPETKETVTASGPETDNTEKEEKEEQKEEVIVDDRPLEDIMLELDRLIGLEKIKEKIREYVDYLNYLQIRQERGFEEDEEIVLHAWFTGNPGTGKTTVVKLLGRIYHALGLLSKGHVHTVEASDLISGYVRQTGKETKAAIEKARGGILFIDEAYMLFKDGGGNDFGPEAVAALITEMSDGEGDIAIMFAGYPKEMEALMRSNPGLKSRVRNHFHFEDYTPDELVQIAEYAAGEREVFLSQGAKNEIKKILTAAYRKRDKTFGNARFAIALVDEAKMNLGIRLMKSQFPDTLNKRQLSEIKKEDIEDISILKDDKKLHLPIDQELLKEAQEELDQLTGLENIKQEITELVKLTKFYKEMGRDVLKVFSMHSIFTGNPGTGKTTVARIMGKFYKALGLLERGHLIDADGSDLVAGWVGQTSLKTKDLVKRAMGGVLFIDEAYSITEGGGSGAGSTDFGKKAIAALIKEMEDHRGEFAVIAAGYPGNMKRFVEANPGIRSRFDRTFHFQDFTEEELYTIALNMLEQKSLTPDKEAAEYIKKYLSSLYANRDKFFGNARSVRKMVEKAHRNQELRMASLPKAKRTPAAMSTLILEDVQEFRVEERRHGSGLGFKYGG